MVSVRGRLGYAGADVACNLIWTTVGSYLLVFYTDVAGLPAAVVGTLFLVTRLVDAVTDPMIGLVIDRTNTRWGRSRPYFLWMSVPLAALAVLTFSVPDLAEPGRIAWAFGTYLALSLVYGMANIPVTSILAAMTTDPSERTLLGALRALGATVAAVGAGAAFLPLVSILGGGDDAAGYRLTMILFGLLSCSLLLFSFATVRERRVTVPAKRLTGVRALRRNPQLYIALTAVVLLFVEGTGRTAALVYFFKDYLAREDLVPVANLLRAPILLGLLLCVPVARRSGKRNTLLAGTVVVLVGTALPIPTGTQPLPVLAGIAIGSVGSGLILGIIFSMSADLIDYSAWKAQVRADGLVAATIGLAAKVGVALGGALVAWLLAFGGYDGRLEAQGATAIAVIRFAFYGLPAVLLLVVIAILPFYRVDSYLPAVQADLSPQRQP